MPIKQGLPELQIGRDSPSPTNLAELVTDHLSRILSGGSNITQEQIAQAENFEVAQILTGLMFLQQDLEFERERAKQAQMARYMLAESALSRSEKRYELVMEHFQGLVWILDHMERFCSSWHNHAEGRQTSDGIDAHSHLSDVLPEDDPVRHAVRRAQEGHRTTLDWRWRDRIYQVNIAPYVWSASEPRGTAVIAMDVTEQRHLELRARESTRLESLGQLAGGVAHDFNNLLTIIKSCAYLIEEAVADHPQAREDVQMIHEASDSATALVQQLLGFSRRQFRTPEVIDLNDIINDFQKILQTVLPEDISLSIKLQTGCGQLHVDRSQIEQVLMNLVVNARDAMPDGGNLSIQTRRLTVTDSKHMNAFDLTAGTYAELAVYDTGTGMDSETRKRVFDPFFTTKGPTGGTGLGLATTFGIVKQSGGNILVYSQPGQGTVFKIYLPNTTEAAQSATKARGQAIPPQRPLSVLLVEDESAVRHITERVLRQGGHAVATASNADEAIALTARWTDPPDLLVTDVVMTGMNGLQLTQRLRRRWPNLPALYVSGYSEEVVAKKGLVEPSTYLLAKPFTPGALDTMIKRVMSEE